MQDFNYHSHTYRCKHADLDFQDEEYIKEYNDVTSIAKMFLSDFMKGINSFDYLEEIEIMDINFVNQVLKDNFNLDKMVLSVVK